ncbi:hypothetical protein MMC21_006273 [Puttea exsequens]|nr:hypothetical protein [Puttea exsequens]
MAGDGYGGVPRPLHARSPSAKSPIKSPASCANSSPPHHLQPAAPTDYFGFVSSRHSSTNNSRNVSPIPEDDPDFSAILGNCERQHRHLESRHTESRKPSRLPNGVRAPRTSLAVQPARIMPVEASRSSIESIPIMKSQEPAVVETPRTLDVMEELPWEDFEIPPELELARGDLPQEIRNIVQESLDEHRAMRMSRLQAHAQVREKMGRTCAAASNVAPRNERPVDPETSSAKPASIPSTSASEYTRDRSNSSLSINAVSDSSLGSDPDDDGLLRPPTTSSGCASAAPAGGLMSRKLQKLGLANSMTDMEKIFMESKLRTRRGYKMFQLLPGRRMKGEPSPDFLKLETALAECISCFEEIPNKKVVEMPCQHKYCSPCFSQLIRTAIQTEASFPPKCCLTEIPKKLMRQHLPPKALTQFDEKALEYAVPVANRFYCVSSSCGKWIDTRIARRTKGALECPHCAVKLCTVCRGSQHPASEECPQDFDLDRTLERAERAGWRRCHNCRTMVELNEGCRHITCKCGAEFCYTCGARWLTCQCTAADQFRREVEIRERMTKYEEAQRAEEEEMRAAVAAIRAASEAMEREQREEEEREIEQRRELERQEKIRVENIAHYHDYLREVLERVQLMQRQAIDKRHDKAWSRIDVMRDELVSAERAIARENFVQAEREKISARTDGTIKALQRKHATTMMETIQRHRKDQDDLMLASTQQDDEDAELVTAEKMQALLPAQDLERNTLKSQQAREIRKHRLRGEDSLKAFDIKTKVLQMRLEEAEAINQREKAMRNTVFADGKWFDLIFEERLAMLADDQRRMERSGADAPAGPKRDTVVFPGSSALEYLPPKKDSLTPKAEPSHFLAPKKDSLTPKAEVPSRSSAQEETKTSKGESSLYSSALKKEISTPRAELPSSPEPSHDSTPPKKASPMLKAEIPSPSLAEKLGITLGPPSLPNRKRSVSGSSGDANQPLIRGDFPSPPSIENYFSKPPSVRPPSSSSSGNKKPPSPDSPIDQFYSPISTYSPSPSPHYSPASSLHSPASGTLQLPIHVSRRDSANVPILAPPSRSAPVIQSHEALRRASAARQVLPWEEGPRVRPGAKNSG